MTLYYVQSVTYTEMELVEICYWGTESYPAGDLHPGKPPPEKSFLSQQEQMQLVVSLIIQNRNGRGANIEKVVSDAEKRGMDRGEVLSDIKRLKFEGYAYEPKNGEICYVY